MIRGNAPSIAAFGFPFRAVTTVDINSQKVFADEAFSWSRRFTVPAHGGTPGDNAVWIIIDGALIPEDESFVILPVSFTGFGAGPIFVDFHANPTYADPVVWTGDNRLGTSSKETNIVVELVAEADILTEGTKLTAEFMIPSDGTPAVTTFGGQAKDDLILVGRKDIKYAFKLMCQENVAAACTFAMSAFEAKLNV